MFAYLQYFSYFLKFLKVCLQWFQNCISSIFKHSEDGLHAKSGVLNTWIALVFSYHYSLLWGLQFPLNHNLKPFKNLKHHFLYRRHTKRKLRGSAFSWSSANITPSTLGSGPISSFFLLQIKLSKPFLLSIQCFTISAILTVFLKVYTCPVCLSLSK